MHILDIFARQQTTCSFEFFPPKSRAAADHLYETLQRLEPLRPAFVSVTYGAGGSSRELTHELVVRIRQSTDLDAIPHLTCIAHSAEEIEEILLRYAAAGVNNILALGGDCPASMAGYDRSRDAFRHATDLVRFIARFNESGRHHDSRGFGIGVAGYPEGHPATPNRLREIEYLKAKVDAGANYICTQLFFDNRDFYDFRERCELAGINVPIIAGVMPVTSQSGMVRMAELALGARIPAALMRDVLRFGNNAEDVERVGIEWATEQCRDLLAHSVRGIHFYTLNRSHATQLIYKNLAGQLPEAAPKPPSAG